MARNKAQDAQALMGLIGTIFLSWRRLRQRELLPFEATLKHYHVLRRLNEREYLYPSEIAEMLFADRPTATVVIHTMERRGWVHRERDPTNRRRFRISITGEGREKLGSIRAAGYASPSLDPLESLTPDEVSQLRRLLGKVRGRLVGEREPGQDDLG